MLSSKRPKIVAAVLALLLFLLLIYSYFAWLTAGFLDCGNAIAAGDTESVEFVLRWRPSRAVESVHPDYMSVPFAARPIWGYTASLPKSILPLDVAVSHGHASIVERLLAKGAEIDTLGQSGLPTLFYSSNDKMVNLLIIRGADPNVRLATYTNFLQKGSSALHGVALYGDPTAVKAILSAGILPNALDAYGQSALHLCAMFDKSDTAQALISEGADPNHSDSEGKTPLEVAVELRHPKTAAALLAGGADPNQFSRSSDFSLLFLVGDSETFQLLVEFGMDVNATDCRLRTPLHEVVMRRRKPESILLAQKLIERGCKVNEKDIFGATPLHYASDRVLATLLLERGADPGITLVQRLGLLLAPGSTCLHSTVFFGNQETIEVYIKAGVDIDATNKEGKTALHLTAENYRLDAMQTLIRAGANVNRKDVIGQTPLHLAIGALKFVGVGTDKTVLAGIRQLCKAGADPNIRDSRGRTPLDFCLDSPRRADSAVEAIKLLIEAGADPCMKRYSHCIEKEKRAEWSPWADEWSPRAEWSPSERRQIVELLKNSCPHGPDAHP